jgi:hypothetical protein
MIKWPKVAIILVNWNNYPDTKECLDSLGEITYSNYEVIVVDNGSEDGSGHKLKKKFPQYNFIFNKKNLGFTGGNNVGMRYALKKKVDYIFLLNNDTVVDKNFLQPLVKTAERDKKIGIVGPVLYFYDQPQKIQSAGGKISLWKGKHPSLTILPDNRKVDYISGAALLIKKEAVEKIGLLDKKYFAYCEEVDWCLRAKKAGYKILIVPQGKIWHKVAASTGAVKNPFFLYLIVRNRILFQRKHALWYHWLTFVPCFTLFIFKQILASISKPKSIKAIFKGIVASWKL